MYRTLSVCVWILTGYVCICMHIHCISFISFISYITCVKYFLFAFSYLCSWKAYLCFYIPISSEPWKLFILTMFSGSLRCQPSVHQRHCQMARIGTWREDSSAVPTLWILWGTTAASWWDHPWRQRLYVEKLADDSTEKPQHTKRKKIQLRAEFNSYNCGEGNRCYKAKVALLAVWPSPTSSKGLQGDCGLLHSSQQGQAAASASSPWGFIRFILVRLQQRWRRQQQRRLQQRRWYGCQQHWTSQNGGWESGSSSDHPTQLLK